MVGFDGFKEVVGGLREERVVGEGEGVEGGLEGVVGDGRVGFDLANGGGWGEGAGGEHAGDLVEEGVYEVRVVEGDGEFDEDVGVLEAGFLETVVRRVSMGYWGEFGGQSLTCRR